MSKILKELSCIVGTYTNNKGEKKNRYQRVGSIIQTQRGDMVKIEVIPLKEGGWDGWAFINDPKPKDGYEGLPKDNEDDIPF